MTISASTFEREERSECSKANTSLSTSGTKNNRESTIAKKKEPEESGTKLIDIRFFDESGVTIKKEIKEGEPIEVLELLDVTRSLKSGLKNCLILGS